MTNTLLILHDPKAARHYYAAGLWREDMLYTLLAQRAAPGGLTSVFREPPRC
jgi:hypothetical protein